MENNSNSLAKISIGINIALIIAVIILFVKMPSGSGSASAEGGDSLKNNTNLIPDDGILKIGYFQMDSLQANLLVMKELEELMLASQQRAEEAVAVNEKMIQDFERKWNTGGTLLPSERAKYEVEAQSVQQKYMMKQQEIQQVFNQEQEQYTVTMVKRIANASASYAEANGYDYIMASTLGQVIYYGSPNFDVTNDLVKVMNAEYEGNTVIEPVPVAADN